MISQAEAVRKLQGIMVSGTDTMSKAELILAVIDSPEQVKDLKGDKLTKYTELYNEYMAMDELIEISGEEAVEITDEAKAKFKAIQKEIDGDDDMFSRLMDLVQEFLFNPPFDGLDDQPYGLVEIATFAYLEYFVSRDLNLNHDVYREKYRRSIADRSYEENANVHMSRNYDPLQKYFDKAIGKLGEEDDYETQLAVCGILAVTNVKTPEIVEMIIDGAVNQAREIVKDNKDDIYVEGENSLYDNANKLMVFVRGAIKEIQEYSE
ncbi:MAG: hypothetical protein Q4C80_01210 [Bacillota bacterium]|nr:hypothetical protein [Bacillota bacterium]